MSKIISIHTVLVVTVVGIPSIKGAFTVTLNAALQPWDALMPETHKKEIQQTKLFTDDDVISTQIFGWYGMGGEKRAFGRLDEVFHKV